MTPQDTLASMQLARDALPVLAIIAGVWSALFLFGFSALADLLFWWKSRRPDRDP